MSLSKLVSNGVFQHAKTNRLVVHNKTVTGSLNTSILEHKGASIDIDTISSLHTPYNHVVSIVQEDPDVHSVDLPTPVHPATLYTVEILSDNFLFLYLPTLDEGQTCVLGFTNTTFFMDGPYSLIISPSEGNSNSTQYFGPVHDEGNYAYYTPLENFVLVNDKPGQLMVLFGTKENGINKWYAVENSFSWYADA